MVELIGPLEVEFDVSGTTECSVEYRYTGRDVYT